MSSYHTAAALITRERAAEDAWITYQARANRLSAPRIAELALLAAIRLADGSFDVNAGLGKRIAERTIRRRLSDQREALVEDMIRRPLMDMIAEEVEALDEEAAWWATMSRPVVYQLSGDTMIPTPNFVQDRQRARANLLRVMESKRKLLGIDRPIRVELTDDHAGHTDPATVALKAALEQAKKRRDEAYADISHEEDIT